MGWLRKELVGWAQLAALWYLLDGILAWHAADKFGGTTHAHKERCGQGPRSGGAGAWRALTKAAGRARRGFSGLSFGAEESISAMFTAKPGERWSDQSRVGFQYLDIDDPDRKCRGQIPSLVLWLAGRNSARRRPARRGPSRSCVTRAAAPQAPRSSTRAAACTACTARAVCPGGAVPARPARPCRRACASQAVRCAERYAVVIEVTRGDAWGAAEDSYRSACKQGLFMMVPGVRGRDIALTTSDPELLARQNPDVIGEVFCELLIVEKQDEDVHALDPVDGTVNAHVVAARARPGPPRAPRAAAPPDAAPRAPQSMETAASVETLRAVAAACGLTDRSSWKPNSLFARWLGGNTTNADLPYPCGARAVAACSAVRCMPAALRAAAARAQATRRVCKSAFSSTLTCTGAARRPRRAAPTGQSWTPPTSARWASVRRGLPARPRSHACPPGDAG